MVYPVVVYGDAVLRKRAESIPVGEDLAKLIADMFETMYAADGMGLAAPQIGKSIRLFVVDATMVKDEPELHDMKMVFVNPEIVGYEGAEWKVDEGCLSLPGLREDVLRPDRIRLKWYDEKWVAHEQEFSRWKARIIQHEYDHLEGKLFIDYLSPLKRRLLKGKLNDISRGNVRADYRILAPMRK